MWLCQHFFQKRVSRLGKLLNNSSPHLVYINPSTSSCVYSCVTFHFLAMVGVALQVVSLGGGNTLGIIAFYGKI